MESLKPNSPKVRS
jgi:hypothetical protein